MKNEKIKEIQEEFKRRYVTFLLSALGLTSGFIMRDLIRSWIDYYFPTVGSLPEKTIITIIITFILVLIAYSVSKISGVKK